MNGLIEIEVAYALPCNQVLRHLKVPFGTTAAQAVQSSGICNIFPEIQLFNKNLGIFGRLVKPETVLQDHDRVEIYRPLIVDPKEKRRKRAEAVVASNKKN
ncbi:MAG: RnfH family protein [Nitrosomonadales bacterium]|jgi:putative ubiquitin-RnfH superfamily antitoxin RatB of RatAB toxin-antitoxin module|nr:MAG: RnfH family protein [Nitrosomonadales bacterium]